MAPTVEDKAATPRLPAVVMTRRKASSEKTTTTPDTHREAASRWVWSFPMSELAASTDRSEFGRFDGPLYFTGETADPLTSPHISPATKNAFGKFSGRGYVFSKRR